MNSTVDQSTDLLESALRIILWRHFEGAITLERVLPGEHACILEHADGTRGLVPVASVVMMEAA